MKKLVKKICEGAACAKNKLVAAETEMAFGRRKQFSDVVTAKEDGLQTFIVVILLIIIAVALGIIFRKEIAEFFAKVFGKLDTQTDALWSGVE